MSERRSVVLSIVVKLCSSTQRGIEKEVNFVCLIHGREVMESGGTNRTLRAHICRMYSLINR
jgi:hypothetical protein